MKFINAINRDFEFDAELKSHEMEGRNIYRLYYMNYRRCGEGYYMNTNNVHVTDWPLDPFILPSNMERKDAFKVLSYLTDYIEKSFNLQECSYASVETLNKVLDLKRLGFRKLNINADSNLDQIVDLYTITGRILLFKQSKHYSRYIEWYTDGVTLEEVKSIYEKIGMEFYDLVLSEEENNKKKLELK